MQIPLSEVTLHPSSIGDTHGQLFWWRGQLLRGITAKRADFYARILNSDVIKNMILDGLLIDTEITDFSLEGYVFVLRHRCLPVVSYPYEWPFQTLKDAALLVLEIQQRLMNEGLTLQDAHPWNVVPDGPRPVYVDFCSIKPLDKPREWQAYDEFCRFFENPLILMAKHRGRIARLLLHDFWKGIPNADILEITQDTVRDFSLRKLKSILRDTRPGSLLKAALLKTTFKCTRTTAGTSLPAFDLIQYMKDKIDHLDMPVIKTEWSDYYDTFPGFTEAGDWHAKHRNVYKVIFRIRPRSVLDIACNRGWYSQLAATLGSEVVSIDNDEVCVNRLYVEGGRRNLRVHPLVMDVLNPSPGFGLNGQVLAPAVQRVKCEMVLALALVHHLVFKYGLSFDYIVATLDAFTEKCLVVEFIPKEDRYVSEWWTDEYDWYTAEAFERSLSHYFNVIERIPSYPDPRILFVCRK